MMTSIMRLEVLESQEIACLGGLGHQRWRVFWRDRKFIIWEIIWEIIIRDRK